MSRQKQMFREVRECMGDNHSRAIQKYYEYQNADREQIEHTKGNQKRWK